MSVNTDNLNNAMIARFGEPVTITVLHDASDHTVSAIHGNPYAGASFGGVGFSTPEDFIVMKESDLPDNLASRDRVTISDVVYETLSPPKYDGGLAVIEIQKYVS